MAGRDEQLLNGIQASKIGVGGQNLINSPNPTQAHYFPIQQNHQINRNQIQQTPFYQSSSPQVLPLTPTGSVTHQNGQLLLPHMNPSQYRQMSPQASSFSGYRVQSPMSVPVVQGQSHVQPGHFIRMPDGKIRKVISTERNFQQEWLSEVKSL